MVDKNITFGDGVIKKYVSLGDGTYGEAVVCFDSPSDAGMLNTYTGVGALGPYYGMTATTSSVKILTSFRYTGTRRLKLRGFAFKLLVITPFAAGQFLTMGIRPVTGYTVEDTGGTDVSAYFGAPLTPETPALTGLSARVAGVPGTPTATALSAGTRTPQNFVVEETVHIVPGLAYTGDWTDVHMPNPMVLTANMGAEICLMVGSPDAGFNSVPGSIAAETRYSFTIEDN
jgi:hypothetical protein